MGAKLCREVGPINTFPSNCPHQQVGPTAKCSWAYAIKVCRDAPYTHTNRFSLCFKHWNFCDIYFVSLSGGSQPVVKETKSRTKFRFYMPFFTRTSTSLIAPMRIWYKKLGSSLIWRSYLDLHI